MATHRVLSWLFSLTLILPVSPCAEPLTAISGCSISTTQNSIDYGTMTRWQLQAASSGQGNLTPGVRTLAINIVCSQRQVLRFRLQGEQASGEFSYGKLGRLLVRLKDARLDNQPVQLGSISPEGLLQTTFANELNVTTGMRIIPVSEGRALPGNTLKLVMQIEPELTANVAQPHLAGSREGHIILILE